MWSARDRAPDASGRAESASEKKEVADRFGRPTGGGGLGERARPQLRGAGAQPQMGGGLHLHLDGRGWLYLAAVLDLFSRRVVGWSMSAAMTAELVTDALVMAIWRRGRPRELLHHSDRGSQYTSEAFQRLMAEHGVACSLSRSGNVWDNAAMESFFSSLKVERVAGKIYRTRDQARADVFDYIERFYNPRRRHSTIGYISPMEFEAKVRLA